MRWLIVLAACSSTSEPPVEVRAGGKVEIVEAPVNGDLASYVAGEVKRGETDHVPVLVYVGAVWCKPCKELHEAATAGKLDASVGPLRLLEFDLDRDGTYLEGAGYRSELVPLIAKPNADGKASGKQIAGVKTGQSYVDQLTRGIQGLLK
jgi:hypothetical protein